MAVSSDFFVSVISALSNDADILEPFFEQTLSVLKSHYQNYEFVLIDDGSEDQTPLIVERLLKKHECVRYIRLSRQFGMEVAISCGLNTLIGDVVVILEAQSDPPDLIPRMVEQVRQTNGIVFGVSKASKAESWSYQLGKQVFYKISRVLLRFRPPENATFFIGLSRQSLNAIIQLKSESKFIRIFGGYVGFKKQIFEYAQRFRRKIPRKKSFCAGINYGINIIINNTTHPLKIVSYLGLAAGLFNVFYIGYLFLVAISNQRVVAGWLSSSMQVSAMFLFVFIILTVLSEYLSRLIDESKQRPSYFIEEEKNSSVMLLDGDRRNIARDSK